MSMWSAETLKGVGMYHVCTRLYLRRKRGAWQGYGMERTARRRSKIQDTMDERELLGKHEPISNFY